MNLLALLVVPLAAATQIADMAVNIDDLGRKQSSFVPLVAFQCGFRNKYMSDDGEWVSDANRYATCQSGKLDVLKYCKRAYPTLNITNIVEYSHQVSIEKWCREEGTPCKWTHTVRPFRCIVGEFHSEALQVPKGCKFSHVNGRDQCNDYNHWKDVAMQQCNTKGTTMNVHSFAMLEPCGLDLFTGVEFVCCPAKSADELVEVKPVTEAAKKEEYDDEYDDDDDSESDEDDEPADKKTQDPYFKTVDPDNEHENFKNAMERLERKYRDKLNKVMNEWNELEGRYKKMATKDAKGAEAFKAEMTNRFQKTVGSLEDENKASRHEVEQVHEQRVQEALNEKKRQATHDYRQALALHVGSANKHNVLKTLKSYIRSEEKDRIHILNRYRHLQKTDAPEAAKFKPQLLHRLRYIDLRINGTLAMLRDFPDLESQVRTIALTFWSDLRKENMPELDDPEIAKLNSLNTDDVKVVEIVKKGAAATSTTTAAPKKEAEKVKVLSDTSKNSEEDDDAYYEDEDDEEVRKVKKGPVNVEQQTVDLKPKSASVEIDFEKSGKKDEATQTDDDDDSDSEEDSDEDEEITKTIKELRVDIEPIIKESLQHEEHAIPAYYRHDKLVQDEMSADYSAWKVVGGNEMAFVACLVVFCGLVVAVLFNNRRRRSHAGFIEVDVCTPEERHLSGMQVTGYENPTYSFFDAKP
ncbi:unnamed protein product, partial [Mesorhabditis spiculigera]